jgi:predicted ATPase
MGCWWRGGRRPSLQQGQAEVIHLRSIGLIHLLVEEQQGQCIIATHSPILMAYPGAAIYSFDGGSLHPVSYDDVPNVAVTRDFLRNPARYLGHLFRNL